MEEIKAITTYYNGYKFRSRLEARWAVFFDEAKIRYEYEPEGLKLQNGLCYLPDFYLPDENMYVEVKPPRAGAYKDIIKATKFVGNGIDTLLILSNIPDNTDFIWYFPVLYWHSVDQVVMAKWCPFLTIPGIDSAPWSAYLERCNVDPTTRSDQFLPLFDFASDDVLERAFDKLLHAKRDENENNRASYASADDVEFMTSLWDKARQARFEYGEKG